MSSEIPQAIITYLHPFIQRIEQLQKKCAYLQQEITKNNSSKSNHPSATKIPSGKNIPATTTNVTKKLQNTTVKTAKTQTAAKNIEPKVEDHKMEVSSKNQMSNSEIKTNSTIKKEESQPRLSAQSGKTTPMTKQRTISKTTSTKELKKQDHKKTSGPTTPTVNNKKGSTLTTEKKGFTAKKTQNIEEKKENPLEKVPQATQKMEEDKSAEKEKVQPKIQETVVPEPILVSEEPTKVAQQPKKTEHPKQPTKAATKQNTIKSRSSLTDTHKVPHKKAEQKTNLKSSTVKTDMKSSKMPANSKTTTVKQNNKTAINQTKAHEEQKTQMPVNNENENTLNINKQVKGDQILKEKVQIKVDKEQDNLLCDEVLEMKQENLV